MIRWTFTDRTTGRRIEVNGPTNRDTRERLKRALREFSTFCITNRV